MDPHTHPAVSNKLYFAADGMPYFVAYCSTVGTFYYHEVTPQQLRTRVFWQIQTLDTQNDEIDEARRRRRVSK